MSHHTVPDPDCPDKALVRRSDIYVARRRSRDGVIDAEPLAHGTQARDSHSGHSAAPETCLEPPPVPVRVRRQAQSGMTPRDQGDSAPQRRADDEPPGFMNQFADYLFDEFVDADVPADRPGPAATKAPRIINVSFVQDRLGVHMHLFISRGARPFLLSLIAIVILLAMGKLSDAFELLARFIF